jgi:hypothetical protein
LNLIAELAPADAQAVRLHNIKICMKEYIKNAHWKKHTKDKKEIN